MAGTPNSRETRAREGGAGRRDGDDGRNASRDAKERDGAAATPRERAAATRSQGEAAAATGVAAEKAEAAAAPLGAKRPRQERTHPALKARISVKVRSAVNARPAAVQLQYVHSFAINPPCAPWHCVTLHRTALRCDASLL
eukprot:6205924-Pleurochrysis_carterae.AAC.2